MPDRTEIQEAIAAQVPSDKTNETNILVAANKSNNEDNMNFELEESRSSDKDSD